MKQRIKVILGITLLVAAGSAFETKAADAVPVDPTATQETKNLYKNLLILSGKKTMFGHQDATVYGIGWYNEPGRSDVKSVTGDYPALYGWEIGGMEREKGYSLDSVYFNHIRREIIGSYSRGGVNTISWHADNPVTGGDSWDIKGTNPVMSVLEGGVNHTKFLSWLDMLADFFLSLKTEEGTLIPIIFRPYHEHYGSWFWWGEKLCSIDDYNAIWRMTVEYLRDTKGVHNLIYAFSPSSVKTMNKYLERYPGDSFVDIFGLDIYQMKHAGGLNEYKTTVSAGLKIAKEAGEKRNKPFAFTETGFETIPDVKWFTETLYPIFRELRPAYVMVWRNAYEKVNHYYAPHPGHPASNDFIKFRALDNILFESELPSIYK